MPEGFDGLLPHPAHDLRKRRISGEVGPQDQRVDEEADQWLRFRPVATGNRSAHGQIGLAGVAVEQRLERRQKDHEERRLVVLDKGADSRRELTVQVEGTGVAGL